MIKLKNFENLVIYIKELIQKEFTGCLKITFNQGGIRGIKKVHEENININK